MRKLPFDDGFFDFVYETCLCYLPEADLDTAIAELFRVCRVGVFFGSITTDMTKEVIEAYELFEGVQTTVSPGRARPPRLARSPHAGTGE